jgi:hypothetical protein
MRTAMITPTYLSSDLQESLHTKDEDGNDKPTEGGDEDTSQTGQRDALRFLMLTGAGAASVFLAGAALN